MYSHENSTSETTRPLAEAWVAVLEGTPPAARETLAALADQGPAEMASYFYGAMLDDPRANRFLSHDQVRGRLKPAMERWVHQLLRATPDQVEHLIIVQRVIGDVHAQVGIPVDLVTRGARILKQRLSERIIEVAHAPEVAYAAMACLSSSIDIALEGMTLAYTSSRERSARTDAAYRLFSLMQNVSTERERQRALLLDWENSLLYTVAAQAPPNTSMPLSQSDFGLWFTHKGIPSFGESSETRGISQLIAQIDDELGTVAEASTPAERFAVLQPVRSQLAQVRNLLGMLFERVGELDAGRDALTSLLNRRFLPTVLRREIELAARTGESFAVLLLDLDHFKSINDHHGHEGGDRALQHVAAILTQYSRGSDYLFRYGGEEFVVVLVSVNESQALMIASELCSRIAQSPIAMPDGEALPITASIGLALHDGHPDYERLMARADGAMYQAKKQGRNRIILATPELPIAPGLRELERR
ncbi:GGDEF domain-containing protein [Stenotrophomonas sp. Marseille-Q4652]|uniref:GGDEF domain-containing protein n=1 Tax=Stenotrophomonas sp. Marseille-Q4652 TaxID=2866595 RepID=UPI001CE3FDE3|nr:GGDEF domain-containing protein [Stenotrophomonas sp. Marseille-Q4652]